MDAAEAGGGYGSKMGSDGGDRREIFIRGRVDAGSIIGMDLRISVLPQMI